MIIAEFSIVPVGEGASISRQVAEAVGIVMESGLRYRVTPMGTLIEGEWDEVFGVIKRAFHRVLEGSPRVTCSVKVDCRKDRTGHMEAKVESVERKIGKPIQK